MIRFFQSLLLFSCLSVLAKGDLVSYWPLDDSADDEAPSGAVDDSGSFNGSETYVDGILGQASSFTADSNYIEVDGSTDLDGGQGPISFSLWCRHDGFTGLQQGLFAQGDGPNQWRFTRFNFTSNIVFGSGRSPLLTTNTGNLDNGEWHHLVGVVPAQGQTRLYLDGREVESDNLLPLGPHDGSVMIGSNPARPFRSWGGDIDEVGIFQAELNPFQAAAIRDLALNPTYFYDLSEVNELFELHESGTGTTVVNAARWAFAPTNPQDGRFFIRLGLDGSGVVGSDGPTITTFTPDRPIISTGLPLTLNWSVDDSAVTISIDQGIGDVSLLSTDGSGSITLNPGPVSNTTYTLTATDAIGLSSFAETSVATTEEPLIDLFTLSDNVINLGDDLTVTFRVFNADQVFLLLNGEVVDTAGLSTISPTSPGSYELIAMNDVATIRETLSFFVVQPGVPLISEFLAHNIDGFTDEDGDDEDWIQLTNFSPIEAVIDGSYYLTDDPDNLLKWQIPNQTIPVSGSVLVFASDKSNPPGPMHANFQLKEEGEFLALVRNVGGTSELVSSFDDYPRQFANISFGLQPDLRTYLYQQTPTPLTENSGETSIDFVRDTNFSIDRGFYDRRIELEITSATPGAQIFYTLDSSTPSVSNGILYTGPIAMTQTTTVRAIATRPGWISTNVDTHTYLFPEWTITQPRFPQPPLYELSWPAGQTGTQKTDYEMQPASTVGVSNEDILLALQSIPSVSIVTDLPNLMDNDTGIYAQPGMRGREWERPVSFEYILPPGGVGIDGLEESTQADLGLRIRGGASRSGFNPKHSFRLFARRIYGERTFDFPLFGDEGTDEFKLFDLRTAQNYSWSFRNRGLGLSAGEDNATKNTFLREVFTRDTQRDLGQPYTRSRYCHVYLNGLYWGLFMTQERPGADFGDSYLGGSDESYDTLKSSARQDNFRTEFIDGNADAWNAAYQLAVNTGTNAPSENFNYFRAQGLDPNGNRDPSLPVLLDIDNLIYYHQMVFYTGSFDGPLSAFNVEQLNEGASNNWYALRNREQNDRGFSFFAHDFEHSLGTWPARTEDRTGPIWTGTTADQTTFPRSNPQYFHQHLLNNDEYRMRFADLTQQEFFNGGTFTNESVATRIATRRNLVEQVIDAEAVRWGDSALGEGEAVLTRLDWLAAVEDFETWTTDRHLTVLTQLRQDGLFPDLDAPLLSQQGGSIPPGFELTFTNPNPSGTVHFTLDGTDPREIGGGLRPEAESGNSVILSGNSRVMSRIRGTDGSWSALIDVDFIIDVSLGGGGLVISEINYHPANPTSSEISQAAAIGLDATNGEDFEFIEIHNSSSAPIDLSGLTIRDDIAFLLPSQSLAGGERLVIAKNPAVFSIRYPGVSATGPYSGRLSNKSGTLEIVQNDTLVLFSVTYRDDQGWNESADGGGRSLILRSSRNVNQPTAWRASLSPGGNPGTSDGITVLNPLGDENGNGIHNLTEAVLSNAAGTYVAPQASLETSTLAGVPEQGFLTLKVTRNLAVEQAAIIVERSSNLRPNQWISEGLRLTSSSLSEDSIATETYRFIEPVSQRQKHFMRVRIVD